MSDRLLMECHRTSKRDDSPMQMISMGLLAHYRRVEAALANIAPETAEALLRGANLADSAQQPRDNVNTPAASKQGA